MKEELNPLMILMAPHDHTVLERLFLGSNSDHILHHGHTPVMVYKGLSEEMENKILVPIDYIDISRELLQEKQCQVLGHLISLFYSPFSCWLSADEETVHSYFPFSNAGWCSFHI